MTAPAIDTRYRDAWTVTAPADDTPPDGYGIGHVQYEARSAFRDLCRLVGFEEARFIMAEIINSECERKRQ